MAPQPATTTKAKGKRKAPLSSSDENSNARNIRPRTDVEADISTLHDLDKQLSYRIRILLAVNADQPVYNETISDIIDLSLPASAYGKQVTDSILASLKENGATEEQIHTANEKLGDSLKSKTGHYLAESLNSVKKLQTAVTELIGTAQARHGLVLDPTIAKKIEKAFVGTKRDKPKKAKDNHINQNTATATQERQTLNIQAHASHAIAETQNGLQGSGWQTTTASINDPFAFYRLNGYAFIRQDLSPNVTEDDVEAEILRRWADLTKEERGQWRESFAVYERQKQGRDRTDDSTDLPHVSRFEEDWPYIFQTRQGVRDGDYALRESHSVRDRGFREVPRREPVPAGEHDTHRAVGQAHQEHVSVRQKDIAGVKLEHVEKSSFTNSPRHPAPTLVSIHRDYGQFGRNAGSGIQPFDQGTQVLDLLVQQRPRIRPIMFDNDKAARGSIVREVILALDERLAQVGVTANEGKDFRMPEKDTRLHGSGLAVRLYSVWTPSHARQDYSTAQLESIMERHLRTFAMKYRSAFPELAEQHEWSRATASNWTSPVSDLRAEWYFWPYPKAVSQ